MNKLYIRHNEYGYYAKISNKKDKSIFDYVSVRFNRDNNPPEGTTEIYITQSFISMYLDKKKQKRYQINVQDYQLKPQK